MGFEIVSRRDTLPFRWPQRGEYRRVLDAAGPLLNGGVGVMGARGRQAAPGTVLEVGSPGPDELLAVQLKMFTDAPRAAIEHHTRTGVRIVSEQNKEHPEQLAKFQKHLRTLGAEDAIGVTGVDTNGLGIHLSTPNCGARRGELGRTYPVANAHDAPVSRSMPEHEIAHGENKRGWKQRPASWS
jgi:hypothetical protein